MSFAMVHLQIRDIIGGNAAFTPSAGDKVFSQIHTLLQKGEDTTLNFTGVGLITTAFLNAALGQLYAHYQSDFLNQHLKLESVASDDAVRIRLVLDRAKEYFADKEKFEQDRNSLFGEE